jgi:hypothetical protein
VIGAILTQIMRSKEYIIAYLAGTSLTSKQDILLLKSCVYLSFMLAPNYSITCYLVLV